MKFKKFNFQAWKVKGKKKSHQTVLNSFESERNKILWKKGKVIGHLHTCLSTPWLPPPPPANNFAQEMVLIFLETTVILRRNE